jgi:hypothetical protein
VHLAAEVVASFPVLLAIFVLLEIVHVLIPLLIFFLNQFD